uniref:Uncharacterized protein n=1 Tax=Amphimedon queenslandica TaxID=400682 RepID=A0A1X7V6H0_AMPQE
YCVNPGIVDLAEEDIFENAAPYIFGNDFERKMKDRAKSVKLLTATSSSRPQRHPNKQFFPRSRNNLPPRGSSQANRGQQWPRKGQKPIPRS